MPGGITVLNKFAIWSFFLGIFVCVPFAPFLAIGLGLVGLSRIRNSGRGEKGKTFAVIGIILGSLWLIAAAVVLTLQLTGFFDDARRDELNRRADVPTREEFITKVTDGLATDPEFSAASYPPELQDSVHQAYVTFAGCLYDVYSAEPAILSAVAADPLSGSVLIPDEFSERLTELNELSESQCGSELDRKFNELLGGG